MWLTEMSSGANGISRRNALVERVGVKLDVVIIVRIRVSAVSWNWDIVPLDDLRDVQHG